VQHAIFVAVFAERELNAVCGLSARHDVWPSVPARGLCCVLLCLLWHQTRDGSFIYKLLWQVVWGSALMMLQYSEVSEAHK
jgi:hypothetical protein